MPRAPRQGVRGKAQMQGGVARRARLRGRCCEAAELAAALSSEQGGDRGISIAPCLHKFRKSGGKLRQRGERSMSFALSEHKTLRFCRKLRARGERGMSFAPSVYKTLRFC